MEETWYVFSIVTRVRANTEDDAFRLMFPALETLRKLDAGNLEPRVELLEEQEPHTVQRVPAPLAEVPPQYGIS